MASSNSVSASSTFDSSGLAWCCSRTANRQRLRRNWPTTIGVRLFEANAAMSSITAAGEGTKGRTQKGRTKGQFPQKLMNEMIVRIDLKDADPIFDQGGHVCVKELQRTDADGEQCEAFQEFESRDEP